jgi:hypothetical protein
MPRSGYRSKTLPSSVDGSVVLRGGKSRWTIAAMLVVALLLVIGIHWGSLQGHFLSDDFGFPWGLSLAAQHGAVWSYVWDTVIIREPQPGNFYRPIGFLSFALNWWLGGAEPFGWRVFNLIVHLIDGWLLYRLARRLAGPSSDPFAAWLAAALFWLFPLAPEVSAWVCARFDALAVMGLLVCLERHHASRRWFDGAQIASLLALIFALGSKESAMTAPAFVLLIDVFAAPASLTWPERWRRALLRWLPLLGIFAAYLLWRRFLFGGVAVEVYANSSPLLHLAPWELWNRLRGMAPILWQPLGSAVLPFSVLLFATLSTTAVVTWRAGRFLDLWLLPALAFGISVGAVLPHFTGSLGNGEGARLFYLAGVWLALWLALPVAVMTRSVVKTALAFILVFAFAAAQARAMVPWRKAAQAMRGLVSAVAKQAPILRSTHEHAFVLAPDHWRTAPFARNAQLAPVILPFQPEDLRDVIGVLTPAGFAEWSQRVRRNDLPWPGVDGSSLRYFCFDADSAALVLVSIDYSSTVSVEAWQSAWQRAVDASACADEFSP